LLRQILTGAVTSETVFAIEDDGTVDAYFLEMTLGRVPNVGTQQPQETL
jgi:hypothetical protein